MINNDKDLIVEYNRLNNSFADRYLIYPLTNRGFASEMNNLCLAVLYCLTNKIRFVLYSMRWNSGKWEEYFIPFCDEYKPLIPLPDMVFKNNVKNSPIFYLHKINNKKAVFLNKILWREMRSNEFLEQNFYFPTLKIDGGIFQAKANIFRYLFQLNSQTKRQIECENISSFREKYAGIHVRRGDKLVKEASIKLAEEYMNVLLQKEPSLKDIFLATDSFLVLKEFEEGFTQFNFFSFCKKELSGHHQKTFNDADYATRKERTLEVIKDIAFLTNGEIFIGTFSSNIGRLVCLLRFNKKCYSVDKDWHPI